MELSSIFSDKRLSGKQRSKLLADALTKGELNVRSLIAFARDNRDADKAVGMEALEHITKTNPRVLTSEGFEFAVESLASESPSVKRESARVIANSAVAQQKNLEAAVKPLLANMKHEGTVVRWSAATALAAIARTGLPLNKTLVPKLKKLAAEEKDSAILNILTKAVA
jgi:HEAT repeat protein